jgi:hypothetical protein
MFNEYEHWDNKVEHKKCDNYITVKYTTESYIKSVLNTYIGIAYVSVISPRPLNEI